MPIVRPKISLAGAQVHKNINRDKLPETGKHVCKVTTLKENDGHKGLAFILEFEVVEGPSPAGSHGSVVLIPDNARASGRMTAAMARAKELGKIQAAVAACYGWDADNAGQVDDTVYAASVAQPSPLLGRLIVVDARPHTNKEGKETVYYEILPYTGDQPEVKDQPQAARRLAAPPAPPSLPAKAPEKTFPPAGWEVHPSDSSYFYNETTQEVLSEDELRARM